MEKVKENQLSDFDCYYHGKESKNASCNILKKFNYTLVKIFYLFGYFVGKKPLYFIIFPILISIGLGSGLFFMKYEENPTVLFVPTVAPFLKEQVIVESHFPINYSETYNPTRFTRYEGHSRVLVSSKDGGSILRSILWPEILELDEKIRNISITLKSGEKAPYSELCSKWRGRCIQNPSLNVAKIIDEIENGTTKINYPLMLIPLIVPQVLGGAVINETALVIEDAKAIFLAYFLNIDSPEGIEMAHKWEKNLINLLKNIKLKYLKVSFYTSRTLQDELRIKMDSCIPYIPITGVVMITACMGLLWTNDCISSKPLIGLVGIMSAVMSAAGSFGFLMYAGATYTRLNVVAIFLVLGIGVDDIFVAISAWQKTSTKDSVPKRLAHTYADAAVSVTITSITNALSFAVGISTPTLIVMSFCTYCCVTIIFAYIWFITFCGGFLALSGYMEESRRHCLLLLKVKEAPSQASSLTKKFYSLFCSSPSYKINTHKSGKESWPLLSLIFRDYISPLLLKNWFKALVALLYIFYLSGAIYGLTVLQEGMHRDRMARDDSYLREFNAIDTKYFRRWPYSIQVVVEGDIIYSDPKTQEKLLDLEKKFENSRYGSGSIYSQFWLRSFLKRLERRKDWKNAITDEKSFVKLVKEKFLANPNNNLLLDVEFNEDASRILASRMIVQTANVTNVNEDIEMMNTFRKIAADSEFNVTCFHLLFSLFDQHALLKPLAITSIVLAVVLVIFVALLFIPDYRGSFAIASSILSIAVGVMGYMSYWNVNLDHVSSGSLFMCIGFSVDFCAHITYTYLSSKENTLKDKISDTLHSLGLPIVQGGLTTVLSLVAFLFIPGYGYRTFFKTIFLVTIFAAFHSIIIIPILLSSTELLLNKFKEPQFKETKSHEYPSSTINGVSGKAFRQLSTDLSTSEHELPVLTKLESENSAANNKYIINKEFNHNHLDFSENSGGKIQEHKSDENINSSEKNSHVNAEAPPKLKNYQPMRNGVSSTQNNGYSNGIQNDAFTHDET